MAIEDTKKLIETGNIDMANSLIDAGWTLLVAANRESEGDQWTSYVLSWQAEGEPALPNLDRFEPGPAPF
ncbi:hypothetical protein DK254_00745 [Pseudomonas sp. RW407]|uniref:hypothetical protein n=1 Tax=Pseudomonas sp. RW407 TaxID=2202894 RepID=UPI000D704FB4|nr:hypothetical protein [Pseudomonas sp. RW407]PWU32080.1 hypothetical protein DK254_00745 [Pseudomonas sp. RW407]